MTETALILGASGRFGHNVETAFTNAGWSVRRFDRRSGNLMQVAMGASVIVNGWNPLYPDWKAQVPKLTEQVIAAARVSGATVIVPGNVYVFGGGTPGPWSGETPHLADNPLGRIRIDMERAYRDAGVRTIILRGGDFLDTRASGNWFDRIMTPKLEKGRFTYPGNPDIDHAWAYLPDMCRAAVELANIRGKLPVFADIPFAGYTVTGSQIAAHLERIMRRPITLERMNWLPIRLVSPFWKMGACLLEMRYLWDTPHSMDADAFNALLPDFRHTPVEQALASAIPASLVKQEVNPDEAMAAGRQGGLVA